jgi:hypothetical protein
MTNNNADRQKVLQNGALMRVRAMRSVFCDVLLARLTPLASTLFSRIGKRSSKQPQTPF